MTKRVEWLDSLRGVAMLAVVIGHSCELYVSADSTMMKLIYSFHMPLFFMVSGATFRVDKYERFRDCLIGEAKRLLVPYVWLYLIDLPLWYLNWEVLGSNSTSLSELLLGLFTANKQINNMTNGALWFLPTLFLVSILYWWLADLDRQGKVRLEGSIILTFAVAIYLCTFYDEDTVWHWSVVPMATVFYYLGNLFMTHCDEIFDALDVGQKGGKSAIVAIVALALGVWAALENSRVTMHENSYGTVVLMLVSALGISLALVICLASLPTIPLLSYSGQNTLTILGFHIPLLRFLENFSLTAAFAEEHTLLTGVLVYLLCVPIAMFVNRFCPFIVGKKKATRDTKSNQ